MLCNYLCVKMELSDNEMFCRYFAKYCCRIEILWFDMLNLEML